MHSDDEIGRLHHVGRKRCADQTQQRRLDYNTVYTVIHGQANTVKRQIPYCRRYGSRFI